MRLTFEYVLVGQSYVILKVYKYKLHARSTQIKVTITMIPLLWISCSINQDLHLHQLISNWRCQRHSSIAPRNTYFNITLAFGLPTKKVNLGTEREVFVNRKILITQSIFFGSMWKGGFTYLQARPCHPKFKKDYSYLCSIE